MYLHKASYSVSTHNECTQFTSLVGYGLNHVMSLGRVVRHAVEWQEGVGLGLGLGIGTSNRGRVT